MSIKNTEMKGKKYIIVEGEGCNGCACKGLGYQACTLGDVPLVKCPGEGKQYKEA